MASSGAARPLLLLVCSGLLGGVLPSSAHAQRRPSELDGVQAGIGYVASAPAMMLGASGYVITDRLGSLRIPGGLGLYLDVKWDMDPPSGYADYEEDLTADRVEEEVSGATFLKKESSWKGVNVALVRPLSPYFFFYAGGGYAMRTRYWNFEEPSQELGRGGVFWVEAPEEEDTRTNLLFGAILRLGTSISTHFGYETQPRGVTVGVSLRLPRW